MEKDITRFYEISKGYFLKVVMIYYFMIITGIGCLVAWSCFQSFADRDQLKQQEKFNKRAAAIFEDKDVEMKV